MTNFDADMSVSSLTSLIVKIVLREAANLIHDQAGPGCCRDDEVRFQLMKSLLVEFPQIRKQVMQWLWENYRTELEKVMKSDNK